MCRPLPWAALRLPTQSPRSLRCETFRAGHLIFMRPHLKGFLLQIEPEMLMCLYIEERGGGVGDGAGSRYTSSQGVRSSREHSSPAAVTAPQTRHVRVLLIAFHAPRGKAWWGNVVEKYSRGVISDDSRQPPLNIQVLRWGVASC